MERAKLFLLLTSFISLIFISKLFLDDKFIINDSDSFLLMKDPLAIQYREYKDKFNKKYSSSENK